jgi:hypothetical protein
VISSNHVGVTTIERLDQGHLYPLGERRDKHVTVGARTSDLLRHRRPLYLKSYLDSYLLAIRNLYLAWGREVDVPLQFVNFPNKTFNKKSGFVSNLSHEPLIYQAVPFFSHVAN